MPPPPHAKANHYTTAAKVQAQLGRTLTSEQIVYLDTSIIPASEEWIDAVGGRAYGEGAVIAEEIAMSAPYTWLSIVPVTTIEQIRGWFVGQSSENVVVIDPTLYRLVDPDEGYLWIPTYYNYAYLAVDYTPNSEVPAGITLAASILCGYYMRTVIHPETEWLTDYSSGQDVRLKFRDLEIPKIVYELVESATGSVSGGYVIA